MWEFTRQEQFIGATTRHPMTTHVKLGAKKDGTLTAIQVRVVSNTGAYGNHGGETLAAALGSPIAAYRCPNKKADGYAVYTNMVPAGGFRGYGATQTTFAIECAIDDLARLLGIDPFEIRRINKVRETDRIESIWKEASDVDVRQLRDRSMSRSRRDGAQERPRDCPNPKATNGSRGPASRSPCWIQALRPSTAPAPRCGSWPTAPIILRSARPRWATARRRRTGRSPRPCSTRAPSSIAIINGDTDKTPYDTGTFASTGNGRGRDRPWRRPRSRCAICCSTMPAAIAECDPSRMPSRTTMRSSAPTGRFRWPSYMRQEQSVGDRFEVRRKAYLSPRSVGFNVHGVRVAVHRVTGEIMTLQSVHAADIGRLINPMQCRGQIDGAIAMGFGWALYEKMVYRRQRRHGEPGAARLSHPGLRRRATERNLFRRYLRQGRDRWAPRRKANARSMPWRPAIANAVANATGIRFTDLPLTPDRIFNRLAQQS